MNAPRFWKFVPALIVAGIIGSAYAKLPPPPPVDPEKAAEAKAKAAAAAKQARDSEEKAMDRVADRYKKEKGIKSASAAPARKK